MTAHSLGADSFGPHHISRWPHATPMREVGEKPPLGLVRALDSRPKDGLEELEVP